MFLRYLMTIEFAWYAPPSLCAMSDGAATGGAGGSGGGAGAGGDGGTPPPPADFLTQIPEEIRGEAYFKDIKDIGGLATRAFHQAKLIGVPPEQVIRLAGPDDKAGWDGIWNRLGRPEAADKYQLGDPAKVPDGLTIVPEVKTAFAQKAHELGLSQKQADALYQWQNSQRITGFETAMQGERQGLAAAEQALKNAWGAAYDQKIGATNQLVDTLDRELQLGGELDAALKHMPAASRVALGKAFDRLATLYREHGVVGSGGGGGEGALSPAEAMQQINALLADAEFTKAWRDRTAPGHAEAIARMGRLSEFAAARPAA